jgi:hypothetical protein
MNKQKIFKYMQIKKEYNEEYDTYFYPEFDGNLMVTAIQKMSEKKQFEDYYWFATGKKEKQDRAFFENEVLVWLCGNPNNFFELMSEAFEKGVIGK